MTQSKAYVTLFSAARTLPTRSQDLLIDELLASRIADEIPEGSGQAGIMLGETLLNAHIARAKIMVDLWVEGQALPAK